MLTQELVTALFDLFYTSIFQIAPKVVKLWATFVGKIVAKIF